MPHVNARLHDTRRLETPREGRRRAVSRRVEVRFALRHALMCELALTIFDLARLSHPDGPDSGSCPITHG